MKGLVLAGGQSTRMMRDKAQLQVGGEMLVLRAARALKMAGLDVFVSTKPNSEFLNALHEPVLFDDLQNIGPAAALLRAFRESPLDDWFMLACDYPNVTPEAVQRLVDRTFEKRSRRNYVFRSSRRPSRTALCDLDADGTF